MQARYAVGANRLRVGANRLRRVGASRLRGRCDCLGVALTGPRDVFAPVEPFLLATAVAHEVQATDRVLDVGTGSGINAILAASRSEDVVAVDNNLEAVACATQNVLRNGVERRVAVLQSDLFTGVDGAFDLIVFDPPFRWFPPRDAVETAITDKNYESLTRFLRDVRNYLNDGGRVLLHFGTSADLAYLNERIEAAELSKTVVAQSVINGEWPVSYFVFRLTTRY